MRFSGKTYNAGQPESHFLRGINIQWQKWGKIVAELSDNNALFSCNRARIWLYVRLCCDAFEPDVSDWDLAVRRHFGLSETNELTTLGEYL
jgi:hypothetical protein